MNCRSMLAALVLWLAVPAAAQPAPPGSFNFGGSEQPCIAIEPSTGQCIRAGDFGNPSTTSAPPSPASPTARPMLWLGGVTNTDRERQIFARVRERLGVAFTIKTDESAPMPRIGLVISMHSANNQTSVSILHIAPRDGVSLYRSLLTGSCSGNVTSCADMIVNAVYARATVWYNIPPYPGSSN